MRSIFYLAWTVSLHSLALFAQAPRAAPKEAGMRPEVIAALVAAAAAVVSSFLAIWGQNRVLRLTVANERASRQEDKQDEVERVMSRFREPLIQAAFDLQSRLYNIIVEKVFTVYLVGGTNEERDYFTNNTLFLIAQFLGWNEIIRREVQFLDLGDQEQTRRLSELQDNIVHLFLSNSYGSNFKIFAGDQRAIGERMIRTSSCGLECLGYADFSDMLSQQPMRMPQLGLLMQGIMNAAQSKDPDYKRLRSLQNALIDLLAFLDPKYMRYPEKWRSKIDG